LSVHAGVAVIGNYFNENVSEWEPLIEPVEDKNQVYRHWELNLDVRKLLLLEKYRFFVKKQVPKTRQNSG